MGAEIKAEFLGRRIAFTNLAGDNRLYIEGKLVDSSKGLSRGVAVCRSAITEGDKNYIIEVTYTGLWRGAYFIMFVDEKELARAKLP